MSTELGKNRVKSLLREADDKWFNSHDRRKGDGDYDSHLNFTATYLVKHLGKDNGKIASAQQEGS